MSLLLEALKKAEKAKQEAQRNAMEAGGKAADGLSLLPDEEPRRVVTRDELPDISGTPNIDAADLAGSGRPEPMYAEARPGASPGARAAPGAEARQEPEAKERAAARKVFEAKYREPNPRLPFYAALAALAVAGIATAGYFWYQLRPPPLLATLSGESKPAVAAAAPAAQAQEPAASPIAGLPAVPEPAQTARAPGLAVPGPAAAAKAARPSGERPGPLAKAESPAAAPAPGAPAKPAPRARSAPGSGAADEAAPGAPALTFNRSTPAVHPRVQAGYAAYLGGDLGAARDHYAAALQEEPGNRDALLGLAAIEASAQHFDLAEGYYQKLLQIDPRDAYAQAGIIALRGPLIDPVAAESRIKSLLAAEPEAAALNFTLGNQLAQQARWAEAQQAYFRAHTADPDSPDVAYNLAISLDRLHQGALALQYYRRALALSEKRAAAFSALAVRNRIADLER